MIDFDALVLRPVLATFGRPIWVTPLASNPGAPSYWAWGDFRIENVDVATMEGIASEQTLKMGIRISGFAIAPAPQDQVYIPAHLSAAAAGPYWIDDTDDDPQGHSIWSLKEAPVTPINVNVLPPVG